MGRSKHWGPPPPGRGTPASPGKRAVGEDTIGTAVSELHAQHPHDIQGEGLHHTATDKRHRPVQSSTYGSR